MQLKFIALILVVAIQVSGCSLFKRTPPNPPDREYRPLPEAWLAPCELPPIPLDNGDLSEAFVIAYECGEQGNADKARIRGLYNQN